MQEKDNDIQFTHNGFNMVMSPELDNSREKLLAKFDMAITYLSTDPVAVENLQKAKDAHVPIKFFNTLQNGLTNSVTKQVSWNPDTVLVVDNLDRSDIYTNDKGKLVVGDKLGALSPAMVLYHELMHAIDPNFPANESTTYPSGEKIAPKNNTLSGETTYNQRYGNMAEAYAVAKERELATNLHEPLRYNHHANWLQSDNPTMHTVNIDEKTVLWQAQFARGNVTITGGKYEPSEMQPPALIEDSEHHYLHPNKLEGITNSTITVAKNAKDISLDGSGNTLNLSDGVNITTHGQFAVNYGALIKPVQGDNLIQTRDGKLEIIPIEVNRAQQQSADDGENKFHQLARIFEHAIQTLNSQDPHLISLAQKHNELIGSIAFYNAASKELAKVTTTQIGRNLVYEIKEGRPLQVEVNVGFSEAKSQVNH